MRWGIETAYETLKDRLQIENFTGTRPILLQDIYSTIYISNLAEDIIRDAEAELDEKEKQRKHKMMINRTVSIGILKNDLIYILLERDAQKQDKLFQQLRIICIYICHDYSGHFIVMYQKNKCRCIITVLISDWR